MSSYITPVLSSIITWRANQAQALVDVAKKYIELINHNIDRASVCYAVAGIYCHIAWLIADIADSGKQLAMYVGSRALSRLNQIQVSIDTLTNLYTANIIPYTTYVRGTQILNTEAKALYSRFNSFELHLEQAYQYTVTAVQDALNQVAQLLDTYCKDILQT